MIKLNFTSKILLNFQSRAFILLICSLLVFPSFAQNEEDSSDKWAFTVAPYLLFPNLSGDITVKGIPIDASANSEDIFNNLDLGGMLYLEATSAKWAIILDGYFVNLKAEGVTPLLEREVEFKMNQFAITGAGLYRLNSWAEIGIGGRINSVGSKLYIEPGEILLPGRDFSMTETWFDPLLVARVMTRFNESKWRLGLIADFGGFGIGSDYAYQINPFLGYQFSNLFEVNAAFRLNGMKYETGSGDNLFKYDMTLYGPSIGFMLHF